MSDRNNLCEHKCGCILSNSMTLSLAEIMPVDDAIGWEVKCLIRLQF